MENTEENRVELRIDARVVRQLGAELITDPEQALLELIKNSYDADADKCRVDINTKTNSIFQDGHRAANEVSENSVSADLFGDGAPKIERLVGQITVQDDGPGVTLDEIHERWLLISGSRKRPLDGSPKEPTKKGRTPLGDKGIGRLGTMRLGDCVQFISRPKGSELSANGVEFRWSDFNSVLTLDQVKVQDVVGFPEEGYSTRVLVEGLERPEHWTGNDQSELQARLSKLVSPFTNAHEMDVSVRINGVSLELQRLQEDLEQAAVAKYAFDYTIDDKGKGWLTLDLKFSPEFFGDRWNQGVLKNFFESFSLKYPTAALELSVGNQSRWIFSISRRFDCGLIKGYDPQNSPGEFKGEIFSISFALQKGAVDDASSAEDGSDSVIPRRVPPSGALKALFQKLAGIGIYRDGFGVRIDPDWLNLAAASTSGSSWYGLRKNNTIGYVAIKSRDNASLVEKSDREGFVDTPAWRQFMLLASKVRDEINATSELLRRHNNEFVKSPPTKKIPTSEKAIDELAKRAKSASEMQSSIADQKRILGRIASEGEQVPEDIRREAATALLFLSGVSLEDTSEEMEGAALLLRSELSTLRAQVRSAYDFIAAGMAAEQLAHEVHPLLDNASQRVHSTEKELRKHGEMKRQIRDLEAARSYIRSAGRHLTLLDPMLKVYRENKDSIPLSSFMDEYKIYSKERMERNEISLSISELSPFTVNFPRGRLMQVVDNIVRNSEYWLTVPAVQQLGLSPEIVVEIDRPSITIWDNGFGVRMDIEDRIFEMFVTDKPSTSGRGLGLFIAREILSRYGCGISLSQERNVHGRRFKFVLDFGSAMAGMP